MSKLWVSGRNYVTGLGVSASNPAPGSVGYPVKTGTGSAVAYASGSFTGARALTFTVEIDSLAPGADVGLATFRWKHSEVDGWIESGVRTSQAGTSLAYGVGIKFVPGSGDDFALGDRWTFVAQAFYGAGNTACGINRDMVFRSSGASCAIGVDGGAPFAPEAFAFYDHNLTAAASITLQARDSIDTPQMLSNTEMVSAGSWSLESGWTMASGEARCVSTHAGDSRLSQAADLVAGLTYIVTGILGAIYGADRVSNGTFAASTGWTYSSGWTISTGAATCSGTQTGSTVLSQNIAAVSGTRYEICFTITDWAAGTITPRIGAAQGSTVSYAGTFSMVIEASGGSALAFWANSAFIGKVASVSVRQYDLAGDAWATGGTAATETISQAGAFSLALTPAGGGSFALVVNSAFLGAFHGLSVALADPWQQGAAWSTAIPWAETKLLHLMTAPASSYRYWRVDITDAALSFVEFSFMFLGSGVSRDDLMVEFNNLEMGVDAADVALMPRTTLDMAISANTPEALAAIKTALADSYDTSSRALRPILVCLDTDSPSGNFWLLENPSRTWTWRHRAPRASLLNMSMIEPTKTAA